MVLHFRVLGFASSCFPFSVCYRFVGNVSYLGLFILKLLGLKRSFGFGSS